MIDGTEQYLQMYQSGQLYLKLMHVHAEHLGGLRWSGNDDALVYGDGRFFAFNEAMAEFIDGYAAQGRAIPFGYLLQWMDLLQNLRQIPGARRLQIAFYETGGNWRFGGAFAAALTDFVPEIPNPPELAQVSNRLRNRAFPIRWFTTQFQEMQFPHEQPSIAPAAFEAAVLSKLDAYSDNDLRTWLKTGRGPIHDAGRIADELPLPRSLARRLAKLIERPRLAGVENYVTQLVGALTLPPRRFVPEELPVGGYTDIVTKGQVEHLLPTQFALDEIEFLRRYADRELLYFRREEPPVHHRQELVVLLDQGVRTWGDVRLVLTAGALAYGKQATVRKTPFQCATTSNGGTLIDPVECDEEALGQLMEASDLSLNPGLALERVLETPSEAMRDIVLLTHPRSLRESDVLDASRRLAARDRLFVVTLDAHGQAEVAEIRHGAAIRVRQFRVDFKPSTPKPRREPSTLWTGDVETIPFPFRLGTESNITHFDFDYDTQWLITVSGQGILHLWKLDGSTQEMLPRPLATTVLKRILALIGVRGGFVIIGILDGQLEAFHYDVSTRRCKRFNLGPSKTEFVVLCYHPHSHSVELQNPHQFKEAYLIELDTQRVFTPTSGDLPIRTHVAWPRSILETNLYRNRILAFAEFDKPNANALVARESCHFDLFSGLIALRGESNLHRNLPHADGKPCFRKAVVKEVQYAGETLSIRATRQDIGESITLVSYPKTQKPDGAVLCEFQVKRAKHEIRQHILSFDGQRIALLRSDHRIEVEAVRDRAGPRVMTRVGGFANGMQFFLDQNCLLLNLGSAKQLWHGFMWGSGILQHAYSRGKHMPSFMPIRGGQDEWRQLDRKFPACCSEDHDRYIDGSQDGRIWFVLDRYGQLTVLDKEERPIVMFVAFRDRFAVWMPDGTRFGSQMLSLGPASANAAQRIAQTLLCAAAGE